MLTGRKLALTLAFTVLVVVAFGVSCKGFFPKPVLQSIAIQPPSPQIQVTKTLSLQAWGTYDDGTRNQITSGVSWSSNSANVTFADTNSGAAFGAIAGTATITASAQALSGTATATVIGDVTKITVSPTSGGVTKGGTTPATFTFAASPGPPLFITTDNGGTLVITPVDTFVTCTVDVDLSGNPDESCTAATGAAPLYNIVMTYPNPTGGTVTSTPVATLTVTTP
jgi:hypothetical protein